MSAQRLLKIKNIFLVLHKIFKNLILHKYLKINILKHLKNNILQKINQK